MAALMQMMQMGRGPAGMLGGAGIFGPQSGMSSNQGTGGKVLGGINQGLDIGSMIPGPQQPFVGAADFLTHILSMFIH